MTVFRAPIQRVMASAPLRVGAAMLAGALLGLGLSLLVVAGSPSVYTARAEVRLIVDEPAGHEYDSVRSAFTQAELLADFSVSPPQLELIGQALTPPVAAKDLDGVITARTVADTLVIGISARDSNPERAAELANTAAATLVTRHSVSGAGSIRLEQVSVAEPPARASFPVAARDLVIGTIAAAALAGAAMLSLLARRRLTAETPPDPGSRPVERGSIIVGAGMGVLVLVAMAANLPTLLMQVIVFATLVVAASSPAAGLAIIAVTIPMREPVGFAPIGFQPLLISATAFGLVLQSLATVTIRRPAPLAILALGFLGIAAASAIPGLNGLSDERTVQAVARLIQIGPGILLVAVAWAYFTKHDPVPHMVLGVVAAGAAGALGIMQYAASDIAQLPLAGLVFVPPDSATVARATGPFFNPNYFGFFSGLALTVSVFLIATTRRYRLVLILATLPIVAAMLLAFSRGAIMATAAAILAVIWARSWRVGLVATLAVVGIGLVAYPILLEVRTGVPLDATQVSPGDASDTERFAAVLSGIPVWLSDPVFGVGFGQYGFESAWYVGSSPATSSHNEFMSILAEQGIVGAVLGGLLAVGFASRLISVQRGTHGLAIGILVALIVGSLSLEPLASLQTMGLAWLALAAGAAEPLRAPQPAPASDQAPEPGPEPETDQAPEPKPARKRRRRKKRTGAKAGSGAAAPAEA